MSQAYFMEAQYFVLFLALIAEKILFVREWNDSVEGYPLINIYFNQGSSYEIRYNQNQ